MRLYASNAPRIKNKGDKMVAQVQSNALIAACQSGDFAPLQGFAGAGVVNSHDEKGGFLLMRFLETEPFTDNHRATLPRLITELNADVNLAHSRTQKTALHIAASFGNVFAVNFLLDHHATIDPRDSIQSTPLTYCASFAGNSRAIECLIARGAQIDAIAQNHRTALHFAAEENQIENASVLLARGANRQIRNDDRKTPLQEAQSQAMRNLFSKTAEQLQLEIQNQLTDRTLILLTRENPLRELFLNSSLEEARLLINHTQFTNHQLEEGFRLVFRDNFPVNYNFIFDLFSEKTSLKPLVESALQNKLPRVPALQEQLSDAYRTNAVLNQPDTRTADSFDLGRGDFADQAMANMQYQDFIQNGESRERARITELRRTEAQIRALIAQQGELRAQIDTLNRLLNRFNQVIALETGVQELAIN
jgi:hypothetical protein